MIQFHAIYWMLVAASVAVAITVIAIARRLSMPRISVVLGALGLIALALAAGEPVYRTSDRTRIAVMVDYSPSTRTAAYRDRAALQRRIDALVAANVDRRVIYFSDDLEHAEPPPTRDLPSDRTVFAPPTDVDAVLLFSDGQFSLPRASPAVFAVIDPSLHMAGDAAVADLELRDGDRVATTIRNVGGTARLEFDGALYEPQEPLRDGTTIAEARRNADAAIVIAKIIREPPDAWPENDNLRIVPAPAGKGERWWVGSGAVAGFQAMPTLPTDPLAYVTPSTIVLNEPPTSAEQQQLMRYVRDLGASIVLLDRALSIDLSPLSLHPPEAKRHWILLIDTSGSMAANIDVSRTRFAAAVSAARSLIDSLPPNDLVSTGGFARDLKWWTVEQPARETNSRFTPVDSPNGPTNLQAALEKVATRPKSQLPVELILITDADATIDSAATIVERMRTANIHASAFALSPVPTALNDIIRATGGRLLTSTSVESWSRELRELGQQIAPASIVNDPVRVTFDDDPKLTSREIGSWRPSWLKSGATAMATSSYQSTPIVLAAEQQIGLGRTSAVAFSPNAAELEAIVRRSESAPRDPRFVVSIRRDAQLHITVDAFDRTKNQYLNGLRLSLRLGERKPIPQTGPGRYEIAIDSPREPAVAVVTDDADFRESMIARVPFAGRYAPEFDAIGINRASLQQLARQSGGRVIETDENTPIDFVAKPRIARSLTSMFAAIGFVVLTCAIFTWRRASV